MKQRDAMQILKALQSKLDASLHLEVISERGRIWNAFFQFHSPAQRGELEHIKERWPIPFSYEQFLHYCNGALLYNDDIYGQWGFHCYGTEELLVKNEQWAQLYDDWPISYLVFAESLGDSDLLILDTAQVSPVSGECYVIDGDTGYPTRTWRVIAGSFDQWLSWLVVAQGAKYWRWYPPK